MDISLQLYLWMSQVSPFMASLVAAYLGLIIGSFSNVVIYRLPIMIEREHKEAIEAELGIEKEREVFNLSLPRSACPKCKKKIKWYDNIPVLSWIILGGKCRGCKSEISAYYPIIELLIGVISGLIVYMLWPSPIAVLIPIAITISLILLMIDIRHMLLPDLLTFGLLWLGLLSSALGLLPIEPDESIVASIGAFFFFWLMNQIMVLWKGVEGIGHGDIKLVAAIAAWTGVVDIVYITMAFCILAIILFGVAEIVSKMEVINKESEEYKNHQKNVEEIRRDFGYSEDDDYKYKRIMPLGPSISIVFCFYLLIEYLY